MTGGAKGKPWQSGDELSAERLERLREDVERSAGIPSGTGMDGISFSGGTAAAIRPAPEFWIRLTGGGTGGKYAWTETIAIEDGNWINGPKTGTVSEDPAVEINGTAGLATDGTTRALAWRLPGSSRLIFQLGACNAV